MTLAGASRFEVNAMRTTNSRRGSDCLTESMGDASFYPDHPSSVRVVETHISWVYLAGEYAYKLKKPVKFEFVDFSTPELRYRACLEELRLNRRLAADVYLAVVPITSTPDGSLQLNGRGTPVDWVVQMRRLPAENAVDVLLRERRLAPEDAEAIAARLTRFYTRLPPLQVSPEEFVANLERHILANGEALGELPPAERPRIRRIQAAQLRYLRVVAEQFYQRVLAGRIVDGHGDLRPEHVYVGTPPVVIDCIEFSDSIRIADVADELSFLAMECERLGDGGLGKLVLESYQQASRDDIPRRLLSFYRAYRASVRAKVALFRRQQQPEANSFFDDQIRQYLELAERDAKELGPPMLLVVGGLMGSGKSTLAARLADRFCVDMLSTDVVRHAMLGTSDVPAAYGQDHYQPTLRERVYDELLHRAGELLQDGQSVVLDGTFFSDSLRGRAYQLADRHGAAALHVLCTCPRQVAYKRIQNRAEAGQSESEARTELYDLQARDFEPPYADDPVLTVDTNKPLAVQEQAVCAELRSMLFREKAGYVPACEFEGEVIRGSHGFPAEMPVQ